MAKAVYTPSRESGVKIDPKDGKQPQACMSLEAWRDLAAYCLNLHHKRGGSTMQYAGKGVKGKGENAMTCKQV